MQTEKAISTDVHLTVQEFLEKPTYYLFRRDRLVIEHEGRPLGYFTPAPRATREEMAQLFARFDDAKRRLMEESGMTEEILWLVVKWVRR